MKLFMSCYIRKPELLVFSFVTADTLYLSLLHLFLNSLQRYKESDYIKIFVKHYNISLQGRKTFMWSDN